MSPLRERFIAAVRTKIGRPYRWGGKGPDHFDCSGLVSWALRECDLDVPREWAAGAIADYYHTSKVLPSAALPGSLFFYGKSATLIDHVMIVLDKWNGTSIVTGARGGNSQTISDYAASEQAAFIDVVFGMRDGKECYWPKRFQYALDPFRIDNNET